MAGPRGFEPRISGFPLLSGGLRAVSWRPLDALIQTGLRANRKEANPGFSLSLADPLDDGGLRDFKDFCEGDKGLSKLMVSRHVWRLSKILKFMHKPLGDMTKEEIRAFLKHMKENTMSLAIMRIILKRLECFLETT